MMAAVVFSYLIFGAQREHPTRTGPLMMHANGTIHETHITDGIIGSTFQLWRNYCL